MKNNKSFSSKKLILFSVLVFITALSIMAQTGDQSTDQPASIWDGILKWVTGGGIVGLVALISGFWKKGTAFIGKLAGSLFNLSGDLGNIMVQATEANAKIRSGLSKLKVYAADGSFSKEELEDLIKELEEIIVEADDVPVAIKQFRDTFHAEIAKYKKD